jgi:RNase P/RNase MRP subunit p30
MDKRISMAVVGCHYGINDPSVPSSQKIKRRSREALRPALNRVQKFIRFVIVTPSSKRWKGSCV